MLPNTAAVNMDYLLTKINKLYHGCNASSRFPHLRLHNAIKDPTRPHADFQKLSGKCAQIIHLVPLLALIWKDHMRDRNRYDMHVEKLLASIHSFYNLLDHTNAQNMFPFQPPQEIARNMFKHVYNFLFHLILLADQSLTCVPATFQWNVALKHNYFVASCQTCQRFEPMTGMVLC